MADGQLDDDRLAAVLASVGTHLVVEAGQDDERAAAAGWWRPLLAAAVVVAVIAGAVLAISPARRAVSDWFRAGRVEVELVRDTRPTASLPVFADAAERIDPAGADAVLGAAMPDVAGSDLGAPSDWWTLPEGGVLVGWPDGDTSLWVVAVEGEDWVTKKAVGSGDMVTELADLGDGGFAVTGRHLVQTPHRRVVADAVVVWSDGGLTYRLEGTGDVDVLVDVAHQLAG